MSFKALSKKNSLLIVKSIVIYKIKLFLTFASRQNSMNNPILNQNMARKSKIFAMIA